MLILENATLLDLETGDPQPGHHLAIDNGSFVEVASSMKVV